jgi:hypothetical protein
VLEAEQVALQLVDRRIHVLGQLLHRHRRVQLQVRSDTKQHKVTPIECGNLYLMLSKCGQLLEYIGFHKWVHSYIPDCWEEQLLLDFVHENVQLKPEWLLVKVCVLNSTLKKIAINSIFDTFLTFWAIQYCSYL